MLANRSQILALLLDGELDAETLEEFIDEAEQAFRDIHETLSCGGHSVEDAVSKCQGVAEEHAPRLY